MSAESAARELLERGYIDRAGDRTEDVVADIISPHLNQSFPGTLLDYFAGQGVARHESPSFLGVQQTIAARKEWAQRMYDDAEAMLAEKKRREERK